MLRSYGLRAAVSADDAGGQEPQLQIQGVRVLVAPSDEASASRLIAAADDTLYHDGSTVGNSGNRAAQSCSLDPQAGPQFACRSARQAGEHAGLVGTSLVAHHHPDPGGGVDHRVTAELRD